MLKFFRLPFATTGDKTAVPDAVDSNGNVSYSQGYGFDYQRQKTDPAAKNIERDKMNQVFFDITTAIAEIQSQGVPDFITSALNGGTAYSYGQYAIVKYSGELYISLVAANTALPSDAAKWLPFSSILRGIGITPPQFDNDTKLATTEFVNRVGLNAGSVITVAATGSIPASSGGATTLVNSASATTQTLPAANAVRAGTRLELLNINAGLATISRAGADTIQIANAGGTSTALGQGDHLTLESDGTSNWYAVSGSVILGSAAAFGNSLSANGYQKLPSGLIVQWGAVSTSASATTPVTFPLAFPSALYALAFASSAAQMVVTTYNGQTVTGFKADTWQATSTRIATTMFYVALGK